MRGYKRGFILIVLLGIILLVLSGSSTMVQNVSASTTYNILYMVGAVGGTSLSTSQGTTQYSNVFNTAGESITWSKGDWASNWWAGVDTTSWIVYFYARSVAGGTLSVTISLTGKTSPTAQTITVSGSTVTQYQTTAFATTGWADRDGSTTWLNDGTGSRTLSVTITRVAGSVTVYWGDSTRNSRMNTGTIVPENLLLLIFAAPLIPLFAKSLAKRGRVKKS